MPNKIAVIGGSGFYTMASANNAKALNPVNTPYGSVGGLIEYSMGGHNIVFLARHGGEHKLPPHKINYRANIYALKELGVSHIIAANAVGGIGPGKMRWLKCLLSVRRSTQGWMRWRVMAVRLVAAA